MSEKSASNLMISKLMDAARLEKARAEKAEAERAELAVQISTLKRLLRELADRWKSIGKDADVEWAFVITQCAGELRDALVAFDAATKAG